jgi:hypothetical protein
MTRNIAWFFSYVFHPLLMTFYGVYLVFSLHPYYTFSPRYQGSMKLKLLALVLVSTFLLPGLFTLLIKRSGLAGSVSLDDPRERRLPFLVAALFYAFAYYLMQKINLGTLLTSYILSASAGVVFALILNFFFKISIHAIGLGGFGALLLIIGKMSAIDQRILLIVFFLIAGMVGSSRLFLGAHKPYEIYTGFFSGLIITYTIMSSVYV